MRKAFTCMLFIMVVFCTATFKTSAASGGTSKPGVIALETRAGIEQRFIYIPSPKAVANVILFAGGHGRLQLPRSGRNPYIPWGKNNFLVRTKDKFRKHGFSVAVVDAPFDIEDKVHVYFSRTSKHHVTDIRAIITFMKEENGLPVWLVGTSRGTESAAHLAIHNNGNIDGLVLTATMNSILFWDIDKIRIPTLIVSHEKDGCAHTPPEAAKKIAKGLINSPTVRAEYVSGGRLAKSKPCDALSEHGFYGIESKTVDRIASFIKSNL